jgi:hypothetical protein
VRVSLIGVGGRLREFQNFWKAKPLKAPNGVNNHCARQTAKKFFYLISIQFFEMVLFAHLSVFIVCVVANNSE